MPFATEQEAVQTEATADSCLLGEKRDVWPRPTVGATASALVMPSLRFSSRHKSAATAKRKLILQLRRPPYTMYVSYDLQVLENICSHETRMISLTLKTELVIGHIFLNLQLVTKITRQREQAQNGTILCIVSLVVLTIT